MVQDRTNLGNRDIPLAQDYGLTSSQSIQVLREMSFGFVDVELNHGFFVAYEVN